MYIYHRASLSPCVHVFTFAGCSRAALPRQHTLWTHEWAGPSGPEFLNLQSATSTAISGWGNQPIARAAEISRQPLGWVYNAGTWIHAHVDARKRRREEGGSGKAWKRGRAARLCQSGGWALRWCSSDGMRTDGSAGFWLSALFLAATSHIFKVRHLKFILKKGFKS